MHTLETVLRKRTIVRGNCIDFIGEAESICSVYPRSGAEYGAPDWSGCIASDLFGSKLFVDLRQRYGSYCLPIRWIGLAWAADSPAPDFVMPPRPPAAWRCCMSCIAFGPCPCRHLRSGCRSEADIRGQNPSGSQCVPILGYSIREPTFLPCCLNQHRSQSGRCCADRALERLTGVEMIEPRL